MAEYRYYLIPDAMTRAFPEQFGKQTPTEFFDNIADLEKRYHQLREMPYNNERTWNERTRFPYARLVVGIDRQNPDGAVAIIQVRNGVNYLCDDYRGPYADRSDAQIPQMAKKLVEVIGVDRVRPHTYTQRDGYTWVQVEKDMHITEWLYAHELCSSLQFTRFLNRDGRELFQVRDGQRVIETNADGTKRLRAVKNIDVTHAYVGHYGCHIQQYAEDNFRIGCYVAPEHPQPGDNLDKLQVYQITKGGCEYRFMNYAYSKSRIHAADYSSVYIANLPADYDLDRCFQEFNAPNRPLRYQNLCWMSWGTRSCSLPATVLQFRLNQCIIQIRNHPHKRPVERRLSQMMYTNVKGYQIPNLSLPKAKKTNLNRYGRMRLDYLEQNEPNLCDQMMLEGTLLPSCCKMGLDAQQMVDKTLHDLMQKAQMPDRKTNPLGWAQMCNSLKQQAEEMILPMLYEV